jgi:hypothetical protein
MQRTQELAITIGYHEAITIPAPSTEGLEKIQGGAHPYKTVPIPSSLSYLTGCGTLVRAHNSP